MWRQPGVKEGRPYPSPESASFPLWAGGRFHSRTAPWLFQVALAQFSESFSDNLALKLGIFEIYTEV